MTLQQRETFINSITEGKLILTACQIADITIRDVHTECDRDPSFENDYHRACDAQRKRKQRQRDTTGINAFFKLIQ